MNSIKSSSEFPNEQEQAGILNIDFKRILYRAFRYWYIVIISLAVALIVAFLNNRYATRIYPVEASVIIRESQETTEGKLIYNNPLLSYNRNYLNELYIIRSYPLVSSALSDLNFGVSFYREGNFLTTEAYGSMPVSAVVINDNGADSRRFMFTILNSKQFQLELNGVSQDRNRASSLATFNFGDTIMYQDLEMMFAVTDENELDDNFDTPFIFSYTKPEHLAGSYINKLGAEWAEEGAGVIRLSVNGSNAFKEIDFLKGLIRNYQEYDLEKKNQTASRSIDFITEQLQGITDSLHMAERQLELFKNKNVLTDLSGEALRLYQKLEQLEIQRTELIIHRNYYNHLIDYIKQSKDLDQVILPSSIGLNDVLLNSLLTQMMNLQMQLKMVKNERKLTNPLVEHTEQKIGEIKSDIVEAVKNLQRTEEIKESFLQKQINEGEKRLNYLPIAERQLVSIQRNYTLLENLYVFLLQKRAEAGISRASTTTDITVVNPPMVAGGPITPKTSQNYMIAVFLGLFLPMSAFVLLEVVNNKVQSREDIEKVTRIPFIGGVGHTKLSDNREVLTNPKSAIAESFRALRSNINYFTGSKEKSLFMITSSISGEGKTFTSVNLASVFALSGKKTIIVGADMRKPKLFLDFGLKNDVGLSSFLAGLLPFEGVVQKTEYENLHLISGGPVPPNPSELLVSSKMEEFVAECKRSYDIVIIDTPPLAIVTDAFVISRFADHMLFLVRQNYTPKLLLKDIQEYYETGRLKNISILLNDVLKSGPGYGYGYHYSYTYGYGYGAKQDRGYYS